FVSNLFPYTTLFRSGFMRARLRAQPLQLQSLRCTQLAMSGRPAPSLAEEIASGIVRIRRRLVAEADRRLAERGKTVLAFQVLSALQRRGPSAQNELAEDIGQHPTGLSRLLEELEHARLVRRTRDRADRRKIVVEVTARGRALLAQGRPLVNAAVEQVLAPLGRAERQTLRNLLWRMLDRSDS